MKCEKFALIGLTTIMLCWGSLIAPTSGQDFQFEDPIRLSAAGEVIDTGPHIAHSGPALADVNNDGKVDLLVGNFSGTIAYFENIGTKNSPQLSAGRMLEADGKTIRVHNW